ncbi:hypothetical protein PR048_033592 [Dryococelus australis]|uniref:Uncharacterized protein n=1 Tax=Dryococelus australis TaxID=614101 RepID=A0ABQ9G3Z6_9NEOP|nr:hypothetical protein PR048_033592 [Dryococelus australis]
MKCQKGLQELTPHIYTLSSSWKVLELKQVIRKVFEDDRNSRILPGKKDFMTSESGRQQVRCLEDDMNSVYEKFNKEDASKRENVSYSTFTRYRAKWVKKMNVDEIETCLCTRHTNTKLDMFPNVQPLTWNYHEFGHGKGAPDGIRGSCKRTADNLVQQVKDIPDVATLTRALKENIDKIIIEEVTKDVIGQMKQRFNFKEIKVFIGTMWVHQVVVDAAGTTVIHMRELSCLAYSGECPYYVCGQYPGQLIKKLAVG